MPLPPNLSAFVCCALGVVPAHFRPNGGCFRPRNCTLRVHRAAFRTVTATDQPTAARGGRTGGPQPWRCRMCVHGGCLQPHASPPASAHALSPPPRTCVRVCASVPTGCACLVGRMRAGVRSTFSAQCAPSGWCIVCAPFWHVSAPDTHWRTLAHPNNTRMRHIGSKTVSWEWGSGIPSCCVA